ncbi:hypothetical protein C8R45DRAFT_1033955, partial [Mycena sanguinolenta]
LVLLLVHRHVRVVLASSTSAEACGRGGGISRSGRYSGGGSNTRFEERSLRDEEAAGMDGTEAGRRVRGRALSRGTRKRVGWDGEGLREERLAVRRHGA